LDSVIYQVFIISFLYLVILDRIQLMIIIVKLIIIEVLGRDWFIILGKVILGVGLIERFSIVEVREGFLSFIRVSFFFWLVILLIILLFRFIKIRFFEINLMIVNLGHFILMIKFFNNNNLRNSLILMWNVTKNFVTFFFWKSSSNVSL